LERRHLLHHRIFLIGQTALMRRAKSGQLGFRRIQLFLRVFETVAEEVQTLYDAAGFFFLVLVDEASDEFANDLLRFEAVGIGEFDGKGRNRTTAVRRIHHLRRRDRDFLLHILDDVFDRDTLDILRIEVELLNDRLQHGTAQNGGSHRIDTVAQLRAKRRAAGNGRIERWRNNLQRSLGFESIRPEIGSHHCQHKHCEQWAEDPALVPAEKVAVVFEIQGTASDAISFLRLHRFVKLLKLQCRLFMPGSKSNPAHLRLPHRLMCDLSAVFQTQSAPRER